MSESDDGNQHNDRDMQEQTGDVPPAAEAAQQSASQQDNNTTSPPSPKDITNNDTAATATHDTTTSTTPRTSTSSYSVPETPRWRFVNTAKKSLGYSSVSAGSYIQGKSAEELAAKYTAPKDSKEVNSNEGEDGGVEIGRVSVPHFIKEGGAEVEQQDVMAPRMKTSSWQPTVVVEQQPSSSAQPTSTDAPIIDPKVQALWSEAQQLQQSLHLQQLQAETQEMEEEHTRLRNDILEAENKKASLEKGAQVAAREEKELLVKEKDNAAAALAEKEDTRVASAAAALPIIVTPPSADGHEETNNNEETDHAKRQKYKKWGMYTLLAILLCVIAALLGVMLSSSGNDQNGEDASNLRGGDEGTSTRKPTPFKTQSPISSSSTASSTEVSIPSPTTTNTSDNTPPVESILTCPEGTKKFDLTVQLGTNPSEVTWIILDRCSRDVFYRCNRCYNDSPPNYPVGFGGCLPSFNNETSQGREYVLQMIDVIGEPSYGYTLQYDGEVIFEVNGGNFTNEQVNHFGEGGGCSEAPSEVPLSTQTPTNKPITPYPTIEIGSKSKGCTPYIEEGGTCGREAEVEFKLLLPRLGNNPLENQMFGSSVAFVGDTQTIIAVGSGVNDSPVHIYQKSNAGWEYLTSISLPQSDTTATSSSVLFGASLDSNDEGYIIVGAPLLSAETSTDSGKVYVYQPTSNFTEWNLVARLEANDDNGRTTYAPIFGAFVSIDGTLIAVGSPSENNGKGSVYVFEHSGPLNQGNSWIQAVKLSPDYVAVGAEFGSSVSIYGNAPATLAVGAPGDDGGGSAFVYKRSDFDWLPQKLTPRDVQEGDQFGSNVVISGCTVAVSSPKDDTISNGTGTVRLFNWDADGDYWAHSQIIEPTDELSGDVFGQCIAMEGHTLLVGSPWGRGGDVQSGVIYHFERIGNIWTMISVMSQDEHISGDDDDFGCPLSLSDDLVVVGSRGDSALGPNSGSAFIFDLCPEVGEAV